MATVVPCSTCATSASAMPASSQTCCDAVQHADGLVGGGRGGLGPPGGAAALLDQQDVGERAADVDAEPVAHGLNSRLLLLIGRADHDGAGVVDVGGHDGLRPGRVAGPDGGDDLEVVGEAAPQRRPRRRRGSCAAAIGAWTAPASAAASAGWSASATRRSWNARLSGTTASRSWLGAGRADREHPLRPGRRARRRRAGVARGTASAVSRGSSAARRSNTASSSATVQLATRAPRLGDDLDQPLGGEPGQRLADRRAAHAQPLGQLDLAEARAGGEVAVAGSARAARRRARSAEVAPCHATSSREIVCNLGPAGSARTRSRRLDSVAAYNREAARGETCCERPLARRARLRELLAAARAAGRARRLRRAVGPAGRAGRVRRRLHDRVRHHGLAARAAPTSGCSAAPRWSTTPGASPPPSTCR